MRAPFCKEEVEESLQMASIGVDMIKETLNTWEKIKQVNILIK